MVPTFVDLFCGIGGFRIGLEDAGFECVYANDFDQRAVDVYKKNRPAGANYPVECADIREVFAERPDNIPHHHVLAAGFPCNPFTPRGRLLGESDPRYGDLGGYVVKVAALKRPVVVLLENVPGFFAHGRPYYESLKEKFDQAGYSCNYHVLQAWVFGLPQNRKRGFIVAIRKDVRETPFSFPEIPEGEGVTLRNSLLAADSVELDSVKKYNVKDFQMAWKMPWLNEYALDHTVDKAGKTLAMATTARLMKVGEEKGNHNWSGCAVYHDLGCHPTVNTGMHDSQAWILTPGTTAEGSVIRKLHLHELYRVQGFPDSFKIDHGKMAAHKQIGNAVPPAMVRWMGEILMERYQQAFLSDDRAASKEIDSRDSSHEEGDPSGSPETARKARSSRQTCRRRRCSSSSAEATSKTRNSRNLKKRDRSSGSVEEAPSKRRNRRRTRSPDF
nr:hypothetical protein [Diaporthe amygdali]